MASTGPRIEGICGIKEFNGPKLESNISSVNELGLSQSSMSSLQLELGVPVHFNVDAHKNKKDGFREVKSSVRNSFESR